MANALVPTAKATLLAQNLNLNGINIPDILTWLTDKFGPVLAEWLLSFLGKAKQGILPVKAGSSISSLLIQLLEDMGPTLVADLVNYLETNNPTNNITILMLAGLLKGAAPELITLLTQWLASVTGQQALEKAVAKLAVKP